MPDEDSIGERLRQIRAKHNQSQAEMALKLGVDQKKVSKVERGETRADVELLASLHEKYGVSLDWLVTGNADFVPIAYQLPPEHEPVRSLLRQVVDVIQSGQVDRIAEDEARFLAKSPAARIPIYEIDGGAIIPYEGEYPESSAPEMMPPPPAVTDPHAFACRLKGASMKPEFSEGEIVVFSPLAKVESRDYVCARVDEISYFRQVFLLEVNIVRLVALNPEYPELRMDRNSIRGMFRLVWRMTRY